jgi:hypothetical protein
MTQELRMTRVEMETAMQHAEDELGRAKEMVERAHIEHMQRIENLKSNWEVERTVLRRQALL